MATVIKTEEAKRKRKCHCCNGEISKGEKCVTALSRSRSGAVSANICISCIQRFNTELEAHMEAERTMTKLELFEAVVEELEVRCFEVDLRKDYSGRGMFGETTMGIVTNAPLAVVGYCFGITMEGKDIEGDEPDEQNIPTKQDNMGMDMIYY